MQEPTLTQTRERHKHVLNEFQRRYAQIMQQQTQTSESDRSTRHTVRKKPPWLKTRLTANAAFQRVSQTIHTLQLHTVCQSAHCPNIGECWGAGTATIMILGNVCTRSCGFCAVLTGRPLQIDWDEPWRVALALRRWQIRHCVITSVDRDDLKDGGSRLWAATVRAIRALNPDMTLEVLVPDFKGDIQALEEIVAVAPEVVSHNMETVERLHPVVRPQARYRRSLAVLRYFADRGLRVKSGFMVGLGERKEEVLQLMDDLRAAGCQVLTIGQYLQPTPHHLPVVEYVPPERFEEYKEEALKRGFDQVESAPLVRSSYHAERHVRPPANRYLPKFFSTLPFWKRGAGGPFSTALQ